MLVTMGLDGRENDEKDIIFRLGGKLFTNSSDYVAIGIGSDYYMRNMDMVACSRDRKFSFCGFNSHNFKNQRVFFFTKEMTSILATIFSKMTNPNLLNTDLKLDYWRVKLILRLDLLGVLSLGRFARNQLWI